MNASRLAGARRNWFGLAVAVGIIAAAASCRQEAQKFETREATVQFDSTNPALEQLAFLKSIGAQPSAMEIEAHGYGDAQKLAAGNDDFGPMAEIYPIVDLSKLAVDDYKVDTPIAVAMIVVAPGQIPQQNPMHLTAGRTNCLYLRHSKNGPDRWIGFVNLAGVSIPEGSRCNAQLPGSDVDIGPRQMQGATADDYAPVSRFTEDENGVTIAGLRCADAWCEFGTSRPLPAPTAGGEVGATIKGSHDEQRPSRMVGTALKRSHIHALIYPDKKYKNWDPSDGKWHVVAHVFIKDSLNELGSTKYGKKWGLTAGTNDLQLRLDGPGVFSGQFINSTGTPTPVAITYNKNEGKFAGVTRWRWTDSDESGWIGCLDGCCLVDDSRIVMKSAALPAKSH